MMTTESPENLKWLQIRHAASEMRVAEAGKRLRGIRVDFLLIKGLAASRYYPEPWRRFFSDIDICVSREDFDKRTEILEALEGLGIDLHCELRDLDEVSWDVLIQRAENFELNRVEIKAPCREDHFRILTTHWLNDGGRRVDKLEDLYQCVNTTDGFDWNLCIEGLSAERRNWMSKALGALKEFLKLEISGHPFTEEELRLPRWFVEAIDQESQRDGIKPLAFADSPGAFLRELRSKFPPNPIQSAIEAGVPIEDPIPRGAQLRSLFARTRYFLKFFILRIR